VAPIVTIRRTFREFWPRTRGVRLLFMTGVVFAVFAAACEVVAIWIFGFIADEVLAARDLSAFWAPASIWLVLAGVAGAASFVGAYATALGGERFLLRLRDEVFAHFQTLTPDFFENRRLGDLMARLTDDIEAIEELVGSGLVKLVTAMISAVFFAGAAFFVRWELALVTFTMIPAFVLLSKGFTARFRNAAGRERVSNGLMNSLIEESLANQSLVQACNRQETEATRLHAEGRTWLRAKMAQARLAALYEPAVQIFETICLLVILGVGAWQIVEGRLTIGGLLAFAAYLAYLYPIVQNLGEIALTVSEAAAGSDRVIEVLRARPAVVERARPAATEGDDRPERAPADERTRRGDGRVEFVDVGFTYPNRTHPTLVGLSFSAGPGDVVVCTGPSGAGKSTLAKLLLRFYEPTAGRILLDGVDIRELPLRLLREQVAVVQQESLLFSGTVRENIAYGRTGARPDEIVSAAVAADAHDFVERLPQGYDTPVGQRGRQLSGGQRQRIAIARAVLRDAPLLVLDEPMTGLDEATAARILAPLRRLMAGRTTILITHDLALVPDPTRRIVLAPHTPDRL
jgi:ATP-binding cassette subfamily B protein